MNIPRVLFAAPASGCGKTTVVCGVIAALVDRGLRVKPFKCGPDFIDPLYHRAVSGADAGNLDSFFTDGETVRYLLAKESEGADIAVLEGAMGYYDGLGGNTGKGSASEIAEITGTPVILVADAKGAGMSLAAELSGVLSWPGGGRIRGVILNRISPSFYPKLKSVIEETCGIPVLGGLPADADLSVPSRHLGLADPGEMEDAGRWAERAAALLEETVDFDAIVRIAGEAPDLGTDTEAYEEKRLGAFIREAGGRPVRIAAARDQAFSFRYAENELLFQLLGAEIVPFSPMRDGGLPKDVDALVLGGGYPELFLAELSGNESMKEEIRSRVREGMPCLAECGGFLYLRESLEDGEGTGFSMAGVLPGRGFPAGRLCRFGYFEAETFRGSVLGAAGTRLRGHEFHHWDTDENGDGLVLRKPLADRTERAGILGRTLCAGFPHFYFFSCPGAARAFVRAAESYRAGREARLRWSRIAHPLGGLGSFEKLTAKLAEIYGDASLPIPEKRCAVVFCGDHGVVREGVAQAGSGVTAVLADRFARGTAVVSLIAGRAGAEVFVEDIGMDCGRFPTEELVSGAVVDRKVARGTRNLRREAAMSREECRAAVDAGRETATELARRGFRLFAGGEMGIGNTTAASALAASLLGLEAVQVTGRGAGLDDGGYQKKLGVVREAVSRVRGRQLRDAEDILAEVGGFEIAALAGFFIGAAENRVPVIVDGVLAAAAALAAVRIDPRVSGVLIASHMSREPAMRYLMTALELEPVIHAGMNQGEGSGAVMLMPLIDMACSVYRGMETFDEMGIEAYRKFT